MGGERVEQLSVCCSHGPLPAEDDAVDALEHESVVTKALAHDTFDAISIDGSDRAFLSDCEAQSCWLLPIYASEHQKK